MFCVCLALSRMPDILSERPLHVFLLKCNCRLVERIFSLIVSLIATPNQVLYFCSIKKSLVWFYFSIHNHFDENHREKSLCSSPSIGTITLSSSLFPHVWFYFLVPPVAVPNHNCTVICNISGLSVGAAQTTDKEISSAKPQFRTFTFHMAFGNPEECFTPLLMGTAFVYTDDVYGILHPLSLGLAGQNIGLDC